MTFKRSPQIRAKVHTVEVVEVDTDPAINFYDMPWQWNPEYEQIPEPFKAALVDVIENTDNRQCAKCLSPVGYVIEETEQGERTRWHWTSLTRVPTRYFPEAGVEPGSAVALLCEDCTTYVPEDRGKA
jgi:hypothetical protein